ncbi:MAG: transcriptional regulator PpsR [Alphaproteobacteria bacterium]|nr:transcriptional regulator PpsR [Alphaproteobacteria bacterium]
MPTLSIAQPDITLRLDLNGVIREASFSDIFRESSAEAWLGRAWIDTVNQSGSDRVKRMVDDALTKGVSAFQQVTQRFPSGIEIPIEYTAVRLGGNDGILAVGKNLQAVAELQTRLIAAQQAMERDYWKQREIETRYRLLFDASNEAVLLITTASLDIVEANPAAIRALGVNPVGREFLLELPLQERETFQSMLQRVREHGKAPGVLLHLGRNRDPWIIRASLMPAESRSMYMLRCAPVATTQPTGGRLERVDLESLVDRMPDGLVVFDRDGAIVYGNRAFLELIQVGSERTIVGEQLARWLGRPGADVDLLASQLQRNGSVRRFTTVINGEFGAQTDVEISAVAGTDNERHYAAAILRGIVQRLPQASPEANEQLSDMLRALVTRVGKSSLQSLVKETVGVVERHYIESALKLTAGNRTAASEILGLSRQSLYSKLARYGLDASASAQSESQY